MKWENDDTDYRRVTLANDNPEPRGPYEEWLLESSLGARHMIRRHFLKDDPHRNILVFGGKKGADSFEAPLPLRSTSLPADRFEARIVPGYDKEVKRIAAVIDDSFNFMNRRFTYRSGAKLVSRFAKVWVQDADHRNQKSMNYGRVLDAGEITKMVRDVEAGKAEEDVLKECGLISDMDENYLPSAMRGRWSHGTHIADLFAGLPPDHEEARGTALLAVQLPAIATYDTSGLTLTGVVMDAIEFTFKHAMAMSEEVGNPLPLVLNFSYGFTGGPRTGRTMLEQKLFEMATAYKTFCKERWGAAPEVDLVIPCGNSRLSQTHVIARETDRKIELNTAFRVQPNDETSSFLELWAPTGTSNFRFTFEAPGADPLTGVCDLDKIGMAAKTPDNPGRIAFNLMRDGEVVARVRHDRPFLQKDSGYPLDYLHRFVVSIAPTQPMDDHHAAAPHGLWRCEITCDAPAGGAIEGWILRDERVAPTPPRGRQAYFEDPGAAESMFDDRGALSGEDFEDSPQSRDRTISNLASTGFGAAHVDMHPEVHVVAGVFAGTQTANAPYKIVSDDVAWQIAPPHRTAEAAPYSATWDPATLSTVNGYCDVIGPLSGLPGEGVREGASIRLNGTSVAAPRFARTLLFKTLMAQTNPTASA